MKTQIEIKRENKNVVAKFTDSVKGTIVATEPIESFLLPGEQIIIKAGLFKKTTVAKRAAYKKTTQLILSGLKEQKINSKGVEFTAAQLREIYGQESELSKIAASFKKDKDFVADVLITGENKLQISLKKVYNRTTLHELEATKELLELCFDLGTGFVDERLTSLVTTFAIRKFENKFHELWTLIYDEVSILIERDIRKEFENSPVKANYKNRLDYCISNYKNTLLKATVLVVTR